MSDEWSERDDGDLRRLMRQGRTLVDAARVLDRDVDDVRGRLKTLGSRMPGAHSDPAADDNGAS